MASEESSHPVDEQNLLLMSGGKRTKIIGQDAEEPDLIASDRRGLPHWYLTQEFTSERSFARREIISTADDTLQSIAAARISKPYERLNCESQQAMIPV
jgi:hypothetical protein